VVHVDALGLDAERGQAVTLRGQVLVSVEQRAYPMSIAAMIGLYG